MKPSSRFMVGGLFSVGLFSAQAQAQPLAEPCTDLAALPPAITDQVRPLTARDLVELIDIGEPTPAFDSAGLSLSPDERSLTIPIRRANPASNSYCLGVVLLDLTGKRLPALLDRSTELAFADFDNRGTLQPRDHPLAIRPRWSPDGRWIAYEKSVGGVTQLWRIRVQDAVAFPIPETAGDILTFAWSGNDTILIARRSGTTAAKLAIAREGVTGYRYDARFLPVASDRPFPLTPSDATFQSIKIATGDVRPATASERASLDPPRPPSAIHLARGDHGALAWTTSTYPDRFLSATSLTVRFPDQAAQTCGPALCNHIDGLWWSRDVQQLVFVRREGWATSRTAVYVWRRNQKRPVRLSSTNDFLLDCQLAGDRLLCAKEGALAPRSIVMVRVRDGRITMIYDPNPGFDRLATGRVERLRWTFADGAEAYGDLGSPVGYVPGKHYPTIVTTYTSRGFLRGATGDEYPIQAFANRGYAVLSFARPPVLGSNTSGVSTNEAAMRLAFGGWADRRNVEAALEGGLRELDRLGIRDPDRTGITGLSDGTAIVQFALLNSTVFAAAVMSSCCFDAGLLPIAGLSTNDYFRGIGLSGPDENADGRWSAMSITQNARRMRTPLLLQMPSEEFRLAVPAYTALRTYHQPVEMYVYPEEGHVKQQPAHRLAIYERNLAWFDFWLMGRKDIELVDLDTLTRWEALAGAAARSADVPHAEVKNDHRGQK